MDKFHFTFYMNILAILIGLLGTVSVVFFRTKSYFLTRNKLDFVVIIVFGSSLIFLGLYNLYHLSINTLIVP